MSDDELIPKVVEGLGLLLDEREQREKFQAELGVRLKDFTTELAKIRQDTKAALESVNRGAVEAFNPVAQQAHHLQAIANDLQDEVKNLSETGVRIGQYLKVRTVGIALAISFLLGLAAAFLFVNWPRGPASGLFDEIAEHERELGHLAVERWRALPDTEKQTFNDFLSGKPLPMSRGGGAGQSATPPPAIQPTTNPKPRGQK